MFIELRYCVANIDWLGKISHYDNDVTKDWFPALL